MGDGEGERKREGEREGEREREREKVNMKKKNATGQLMTSAISPTTSLVTSSTCNPAISMWREREDDKEK